MRVSTTDALLGKHQVEPSEGRHDAWCTVTEVHELDALGARRSGEIAIDEMPEQKHNRFEYRWVVLSKQFDSVHLHGEQEDVEVASQAMCATQVLLAVEEVHQPEIFGELFLEIYSRALF